MRYLRFTFIIPVLLFFYYSCDDGFENYSTNPNDRLTFSTDTVAFDTIISTITTPFKAFKVYNNNSKNLLVSSVYLETGEQSNFRINVDGRGGGSFQDVEIRANDSIFVFVDAIPAETGLNIPEQINDYIVFVTNGIQQKVLIEASAQDAFIWEGVVLDSDLILSNEKPYVIYDSLVIEKDITVQIQEGAIFYMHGNAEIIVKGTLNAKGTLENPIVFRGDRFDTMVNISYDLIPGQWGGFRFDSDSYNNEWEYVYIRNGTTGLNFELSDPSISKIKMKNVVITNFKGVLINSVNCNIEAENCEFSNSQYALLNAFGGSYSFTHCTFANHYLSSSEAGWGNSDNSTIILRNEYITGENKEYYPVTQADFLNCIIWGTKNTSTSRISIKKSDESDIAYYFENCLLPINLKDDWISESFVINCILNENPEFKTLLIGEDGTNEFIYDFRLMENSPAINNANRTIAETIPFDINGIDRLADENPDMGVYEFVLN